MKKIISLLLLAAATPCIAQASESNGIGYSHIQLDLQHDEVGYGMNGAALSGSYAATDNIFVTANYGQTRWSDSWTAGGTSYRLRDRNKFWSLGMGVNTSIGNRADWVSQVGLAQHRDDLRATAKQNGTTFYDTGAWAKATGGYVSTGINGRINDKLTANAYLGYQDFNHGYEGSLYGDFGMVYAFTKTWGMHSGVKVEKGAESYQLGVRASF